MNKEKKKKHRKTLAHLKSALERVDRKTSCPVQHTSHSSSKQRRQHRRRLFSQLKKTTTKISFFKPFRPCSSETSRTHMYQSRRRKQCNLSTLSPRTRETNSANRLCCMCPVQTVNQQKTTKEQEQTLRHSVIVAYFRWSGPGFHPSLP